MEAFSHLKKLSTVKSNKGIRFLTPLASPSSHCPMHTALHFISTIKGLSSLVIGTPECTTYSRIVLPQVEGADGEHHWLYVLDANEVVFGCEKGLKDAIIKMDKAGAKVIMLIQTCVPELIGEDMDAIVHELTSQIVAKLVYVKMAHFRCNSYPSGTYRSIEAMAALAEVDTKEERIVNIIGANATSNLPIIQDLIKNKYSIRYLGIDSAVETYQEAGNSVLNITVSLNGQPYAMALTKEIGMPTVGLHNLYDVEEIDAAYREIETILDIQLSEAVSIDREDVLGLEEQLKQVIHPTSYGITRIGIDPLPLMCYLIRFGLEPVLVHLEDYYPEDKIFTKQAKSLGVDPFVCHLVNPKEDSKLIQSLELGFLLGGIQGMNRKPVLKGMYELLGDVGYSRTKKLLMSLSQMVSEGGA